MAAEWPSHSLRDVHPLEVTWLTDYLRRPVKLFYGRRFLLPVRIKGPTSIFLTNLGLSSIVDTVIDLRPTMQPIIVLLIRNKNIGPLLDYLVFCC